MAAIGFYRYISDQSPVHVRELRWWLEERRVRSAAPSSSGTWFSPTRYENPVDALRDLALPYIPTHRIGPIGIDQIPGFTIELRRSQPLFGQPGGGVEARGMGDVWLFGCWNFQTSDWEY